MICFAFISGYMFEGLLDVEELSGVRDTYKGKPFLADKERKRVAKNNGEYLHYSDKFFISLDDYLDITNSMEMIK